MDFFTDQAEKFKEYWHRLRFGDKYIVFQKWAYSKGFNKKEKEKIWAIINWENERTGELLRYTLNQMSRRWGSDDRI